MFHRNDYNPVMYLYTRGAVVYAGDHNGSEQTDPLQPLPTDFESWMGNRITPCNLSELIG